MNLRTLNYRAVRNAMHVATDTLADDAARVNIGVSRMLAWRVHSYGEELQLEEARVPALRAPSDVLVRVQAASINPLDIAMIRGYGSRVLNTLRAVEDGGGVEFPLVVGRDFAGQVERAGPAAGLRRGDRVWGVLPPHAPGSHAQYVLAKRQWVGLAPASLNTLSCGGALYAALSACGALRAAGLAAGSGADTARGARVLLLGLGGVGHAALQLLVHAGAQVVVGCAAERCGAALARGAAAALDRTAPDYDRQLCDHGPYDVILDCAGLGGWEAGARRWQFARYVTLTTPLLRETDARGLPVGSAWAAAQLAQQCAAAARAPHPAPHRSVLPPHVRWAYFMPCASDIEMLRRLADAGKLVVEVERAWPWREGAAAWGRAAQGHARGKLLLDFTR